jgi:GT2 family glycosyltransferase
MEDSDPKTSRYTIPWAVINLDLSGGAGELALAADCGGAFVIFWWDRLPLGECLVPSDQFPLSAPQVRDLAAAAIAPAVAARLTGEDATPDVSRQKSSRYDLARDLQGEAVPDTITADLSVLLDSAFDDAGEGDVSPRPRLSVIVCTRGRPGPLFSRCLAALAAQSDPADEVIVVDNNDPDAVEAGRSIRRAVQEAFPSARYVQETRPGLSAARNAGVRAATGSLIAFTDDDVEAHPDWVLRLRRAFTDPKVLAVTGLVLPAELDTAAQRAFETGMGGFSQGYAPLRFDHRFFAEHLGRGVPVWRVGAGANMAFRAAAFADLGLFDERLGAGVSGCSEDSEFWYRVLAAGGECRYEPSAVTFHHHRDSEAALLSQAFYYMRGHVTALLVQWRRHGHIGNLRRLLLTLPAYYAYLGWRHATRAPGFDDPLDRRLIRAQVRGMLAAVPYYLRNRGASPAGLVPGTLPAVSEPGMRQRAPSPDTSAAVSAEKGKITRHE